MSLVLLTCLSGAALVDVNALPSRLGDLDEDGEPTVLDLTRLINHVNRVTLLSNDLTPFADLNQDGAVSEEDIQHLAKVILGLEPFRDAPPVVRRVSPLPAFIAGSINTVLAEFSEPIATASLNANTFKVFATGPDNIFGTGDDVVVTTGTISYRDTTRAAVMTFSLELPPGWYQAQLLQPIADLAGNQLRAPYRWTFRVFNQADADQDGVPDDLEAALSLSRTNPDSNGNGILDGAEDFDRDGLLNMGEILMGTNPAVADTDGDQIRDGDEDADNDALTDGREILLGTNPFAADSDSDGWPDEAEVTAQSDPLDRGLRPKLFTMANPGVSVVLPTAVTPEGGLLHGVTVACPIISVVLPTSTTPPGETPFGITIAQPTVAVVLPSNVIEGGLASGTTVANPSVSVVLTSNANAGDLPYGTTVAPPPVSVVLPATVDAGVVTSGTSIARPPVSVVLPSREGTSGLEAATTIGRPPVRVRISD